MGRRKADAFYGGKWTAEGVSFGRAVTWRDFIRGQRKNLCGVKRWSESASPRLRFCVVAVLWVVRVGVEFRLLGADVGVIGRARIGWARIGWGSASTCG